MNTSGDAAEQVVRISLEGMEVTIKILGNAAKNVAAALYASAKNKDKKTKGKARLTDMLKSGKPMMVFTVKESEMKKFTKEAKRYGVLYCALKGVKSSPDGVCDLLVRAEDAPKINRIIERFELSAVNSASIKQESYKDKANVNERLDMREEEKGETDRIIDELFSEPVKPETQKNPFVTRTEKESPSEPSLKNPEKVKDTTRQSVRSELYKIKASRQERTHRTERDGKRNGINRQQETKHKGKAR